MVESSTSALLVLLGILGNSLLLVSLYRKPRLKSSTGSLIAALAMTDLLNACIPGALFWLSLTTGKMSISNFGCQISGFFMHFLTYASMATMTLTAINRYVCVLKPKNVSRKTFSYNLMMLYIASLWCFVAVIAFLPIVSGSSTFAFNLVMASCIMKFTTTNAEIGFTLFIGAFFVVWCLIIISVWYFREYRFIRHHNMSTISQLSMQEINLTKAFVLVFTFGTLWIPAYLMIVLTRLVLKTNLPRQFVLVVPYLIYFSSALNPWTYGVMCPLVRNKMKKTVFAWRGRGSTVSAGPEIIAAMTLAPPRLKSAIGNIAHVSDLANANFITNLPGALAPEIP